MKTELKAKFLQHMVQKKQDKGFTLIELLVVIIIIGILSAIALPSFLNQAAKAKQTEAKNYVGSVNRAQQAYRIENNTFAGTITELEIGIPEETQSYTYSVTPTTGIATKTAILATTGDDSLREYSGGVTVLGTGQTAVAACETEKTSGAGGTAAEPTLDTSQAVCPGGMRNMK
jgi:type IV pilus assembly protein PilA